MYRKIVWHGTVLVTDIKEMLKLVLESENKSIFGYMYNVIQKNVDTFDHLSYNF